MKNEPPEIVLLEDDHSVSARRARYGVRSGAAMRNGSSHRSLLSLLALLSLVALVGACSSPAEPNDENAVSAGEQALTSNEKAAYDFFVSKGLSKVQAAGVVGNLIQESNVLPGAVEPGGPGRGIAQWSVGARWNASPGDNMAWYAAVHGGLTSSLTMQLDFIWYELETFPRYGLSSLRAASTVKGATVAFQSDFEGCGRCEETTRVSYAEQVLSAYGGGASGGGGAGDGSQATKTTCYSTTFARTMPENACIQSRSDRLWYQCDNGSWVDRWSDPTACNGTYPL